MFLSSVSKDTLSQVGYIESTVESTVAECRLFYAANAAYDN